MAELNSYELSMTGQEADTGIRVGIQLGALNGIPYSNGNNEISEARPGTDYGYPLLQGNGPPTANTAANFGQHYYDLSATEPPYEYICVAFTESGGFVWKSHDDAAMHAAIYNAYVTATAFGEIAEIDDGADNIPVKSLVVDIDPAQSGWAGAKVTRSGKNLLPAVVKTTSQNGVTYDRRADGTVRVYGATNQGQRSYGYLDVPTSNIKGGLSYVIGGCPANGSQTTYSLGVQWTLNGALGFGQMEWGQGLSAPFVIPKGATYVQIFIRVEANITLDLIFKPTIQLADNSSTGFEPYSADTYNISFPAEAGTVYGGTLDVINGVLTVSTGSAPGTYQLTPIVIKTLLGINNFWADTGDVNVSYRADPTLIYNKLTAAIISSGGI